MANNESKITAGDNGSITYSADVISTIAGLAATEVDGVVALAGGLAGGLAELLGKKNLTNGVKAELQENTAKLEVYLTIKKDTLIPDMGAQVQQNVKHAVETMTGIKVTEVNVYVQGIVFDETGAQNKN